MTWAARFLTTAILALLGWTGLAQGQTPPPTLPANTVYGRLGIGPGPGQAIPFNILFPQLFSCINPGAGSFPIFNTIDAKWECSTTGNAGSVATLNGGPFTVNTTPNTYTRGVVTSQTSPLTGSVTGPALWNVIDVTQSATITGAGTDAFSLLNTHVDALRVQLTVAGNATGGPFVAGQFAALVTATGAQTETIGLTGAAYTNVATGIGNNGSLSGTWGYSQIGASGSLSGATATLVGVGCEAGIATGGSAPYRFACLVRNISTATASTLDAGIGIASGTAGGSFLNGIAFTTYAGASPAPIQSAGNLFFAEAFTVTNVHDFHNLTVTGNIASYQNMAIAGSGRAIFGAGAGSLPSAPIVLIATCPSCGQSNLQASTNVATTSAGAGLQAQDSSNNNILFAGVEEALNSGTTFGTNNTSIAKIVADGSANLGLFMGTIQNVGMVFGTHNLTVETMYASGCVAIGRTAADCGAPGILNLGTGLRIANVATSGQYIRCNGTNCVLGAIQSGDLPGGSLVSSVSNSDGTLTISPTTGAVVASLNLAQANIWTAAITQTINQNGTTSITVNNNSTGTSALVNIVFNNSANFGSVGLGGTGYTGATILQNRAFINASTGSAGIVLFQGGANPTIFTLNSAEVGRFDGSTAGLLKIGLLNTTLGQIQIFGNTSGSVTQTVQTAAGSPTVTWGSNSGTPAVTASGPLAITAATGNIACSTCATTTNGGALSATAPITISAAGVIALTSPLTGTFGGTGINNGASTITIAASLTTTGTGAPTLTFPSSSFTYTFQGSSDTIVGRATTDTLTNKTYDTAGTGNVFKINGTQVSAVTGTGSTAVLSTSPTLATPTFTTSATTPIIYGGSVAASTLTLASTSGAGTSDAVIFQSGSQVEAGRINTSQLWRIGAAGTPNSGELLTISGNAASLPAGQFSQVYLHIGGVDGTAPRVVLDTFGASSSISFRRTNGTNAARTTLVAGNQIGGFLVEGYNGTNYTMHACCASITFNATETWSTSTNGTEIQFVTSPNGGGSNVTAAKLLNSGGLSISNDSSTFTDPAQGGLWLGGQIYAANMATDGGAADATVCRLTGSSPAGKIATGTGTLSICIGTSGAQFKDLIGMMPPVLDQLATLPMREYYYHPGYGDGGARLQRGPTAQDVAAVFPDLVRYDRNREAIAYDWGALIFFELRALQELKAANDNLRADNDNLHAQLAQLRKAK